MLAYFDTSALVPLLINEPSTARCTAAWNDADGITTTALSYVETHAALAQAIRRGRLSADDAHRAQDDFETIWDDIVRIPATDVAIRRAATLSSRHALRGYDAIHCATALVAASEDFVAVSGDRDLLRAWSELGIATVDVSR